MKPNRANEELSEWISEYYLGRDCSCDADTKCQVCSLADEIKSQLDKKDKRLSELEAELERVNAERDLRAQYIIEKDARLAEATRILMRFTDKKDWDFQGFVKQVESFLSSPTNSEARGGCEHDRGDCWAEKCLFIPDTENVTFKSTHRTCPFCDKKTGGV